MCNMLVRFQHIIFRPSQMSYTDLPPEIWEEIITGAPAPAAAQFLATGRTVRDDLYARQQARLAQAKEEERINRLKVAAQQWLIQQAEARVAKLDTGSMFRQGKVVSPALTALLGANFPRVQVGDQILAVGNVAALTIWFDVYIRLNAAATTAGFVIDETLSQLSGDPVGTLHPYAYTQAIIFRNVVSPITLTPSQEDELFFIEAYLTAVREVLSAKVINPHVRRRPAALKGLQQVDPQLEGFAALRLQSPPRRG